MDAKAISRQFPAADAIELEIFKHLFASIAEEMGVRLMRSAYSPNIKERRDFSCALFNASAELLAQAAHIPVHLGAMPDSIRAVLSRFDAGSMCPSDRFVLNDPYAGGTHLPDITLVAPVILDNESRPRFFVANRAHHADIGGTAPGSMALATSIDEEGVRLPPTRLTAAIIGQICDASRTPVERRGDLQAQLAALDTGQQRLAALCERYTPNLVSLRGQELLGYAESLVRHAIAALPNGIYEFVDYLDDDGFGIEDIAIQCKLRIDGEQLVADFSNSAQQVRGPVNAVKSVTSSAVNYVVHCLVQQDLPSNGGVIRPVRVITQPGTVVDAQFPAAVAAGNVETSQRIVDVLLGALGQACPKLIPAASAGSMTNIAIGGHDSRTGLDFAYYETIAGGAGGGPHRPGAHAMHTHMTNTRNTPVEALEHAYPLRISSYRIRRNSGGTGQHRGGDGLIRTFHFYCPAEVTLLTERRRRPPYGLAAGQPGLPGENVLIDVDGRRTLLAGKCAIEVTPGQSIEIATPGGGGWGAENRGTL